VTKRFKTYTTPEQNAELQQLAIRAGIACINEKFETVQPGDGFVFFATFYRDKWVGDWSVVQFGQRYFVGRRMFEVSEISGEQFFRKQEGKLVTFEQAKKQLQHFKATANGN
jgi:hypothetical protein